ncbi:MmcQ/YjbR family DNA-binding protein [Streptomyces sp. NPDC001515]
MPPRPQGAHFAVFDAAAGPHVKEDKPHDSPQDRRRHAGVPVSADGDRLQDTAHEAALALPDVSRSRPFTPQLDVYKVAGKVFLIVTDDPDEQIITVTCEPEHARAHVHAHDSITPGRYLDKRHWITIGPGPGITERLITDAVEDSYDLVVERLPRRDRPRPR